MTATSNVKQHHRSLHRAGSHVHTPIQKLDVSTYLIPTDGSESDGTLEWQHTLLVLVEVQGGGLSGLGYTYASHGSAYVIKKLLADVVVGHDALSVEECWWSMVRASRNVGRPGAVAMAISAVDAALWDLKARFAESILGHTTRFRSGCGAGV